MDKCYKCGSLGEFSILLAANSGRWFMPNHKVIDPVGPPLTEILLCEKCAHDLDTLITEFLPQPPKYPHDLQIH